MDLIFQGHKIESTGVKSNLQKFDITWELDSNLPTDSILAAPDLVCTHDKEVPEIHLRTLFSMNTDEFHL